MSPTDELILCVCFGLALGSSVSILYGRLHRAHEAKISAEVLKSLQWRGLKGGGYDGPFPSDSFLVNSVTGLPMNEEEARAYAEVLLERR